MGRGGAWLVASGSVQASSLPRGTYDIKSDGKVTGTLVKVAFTNPHGAIDDLGDNGMAQTRVDHDHGLANTLQNLGFGKTAEHGEQGDTSRSRTLLLATEAIGFIRSITLPDKREVTLSNGGSND